MLGHVLDESNHITAKCATYVSHTLNMCDTYVTSRTFNVI